MGLNEFLRQMSVLMGLPTLVLLGVAAGVVVVARDWRLSLLAYAIVSSALALLLTQRLPMEWALLQAIVGGLASVILFLSARQLRGVAPAEASREMRWPQLASLSIFRLLALALVAVGFLAVRDFVRLPQTSTLLRDAVLWLGLVCLLGLALHEEPFHAGLALLTGLGGFTLLIFGLTQSRLMVGLIDGWQILLALAISYLTVSRGLALSVPSEWQP